MATGQIAAARYAVDLAVASNGQVALQNAGTITTLDQGVRIVPAGEGISGFVYINNTGTITAARNTAVTATAGPDAASRVHLTNTGTILSDTLWRAVLRGGSLWVTNSGAMLGNGPNRLALQTFGETTLNNSGRMQGNVSLNNARAEVVNTGLIDGPVFFGNTDDRLDTRGRRITGQVFGGNGNDSYFVDDTPVAIVEADNGGTDTVISIAESIALPNGIELLTLMSGARVGIGNAAANWINGNGLATTLIGGGGNDDIFGAAGNDWIDGGTDDDQLYGGSEADTILGGLGNDIVFGGVGRDWVYGESGNDTAYGDGGDDFVCGGAGDDILFGGEGENALDGGTGNDTLDGGEGGSTMTGGLGSDSLVGGLGRDVLAYRATGDARTARGATSSPSSCAAPT